MFEEIPLFTFFRLLFGANPPERSAAGLLRTLNQDFSSKLDWIVDRRKFSIERRKLAILWAHYFLRINQGYQSVVSFYSDDQVRQESLEDANRWLRLLKFFPNCLKVIKCMGVAILSIAITASLLICIYYIIKFLS